VFSRILRTRPAPSVDLVTERVQEHGDGGGSAARLDAAVHTANVVSGDRLGLYRTLAAGPCTPAELAARTGVGERHVARWLAGRAARGDVATDGHRFGLAPENTSLPLVLTA
jgi:hypothetical protein